MMQQTAQLLKKPQQEQKQVQNQKPSANKAIIFDSGVLISFSMNGITELIRKLKGIFSGKFLITQEIKKEIIDTPLQIKRFQLEALKLKKLLDEGVIELPSSLGISDGEVSSRTAKILEMANTALRGDGRDLHLLDRGESSCLALSKILSERGINNILAIDERTTRTLVEDHENQRRFLEKKLHVKIKLNHENTKFFTGFKIIRSAELVYVAYKKNLIELKNGDTLDALLYAVKSKGSAISGEEIEQIKKLK